MTDSELSALVGRTSDLFDEVRRSPLSLEVVDEYSAPPASALDKEATSNE